MLPDLLGGTAARMLAGDPIGFRHRWSGSMMTIRAALQKADTA
jgi:hypothetical protein